MNGLKVTDIRIFPIPGSDKILANGSITYNDCFVIKVKIWNGSQGPWVGSEGQRADVKNKETGVMEKKWFDAYFFKNKEAKQTLMTEPVLNAYHKQAGGNNTRDNASSNTSSNPNYGHSGARRPPTALGTVMDPDEVPFRDDIPF